ncbi:uncharacterized protein LOC133897011 [Phragmites australis]|uniref:uncharacterized protein LOC133897011 n=1 Tax=Phragmites australis TaxID=29695 RepID=UPI002D78BC8F|nr:uncharacterized protein LOC133897011 [Phragmites australis]
MNRQSTTNMGRPNFVDACALCSLRRRPPRQLPRRVPSAVCLLVAAILLHSAYAHLSRLIIAARGVRCWRRGQVSRAAAAITASLDLTEENVRRALVEAKSELGQLFDTSVGITGEGRAEPQPYAAMPIGSGTELD